MQTIKVNGCDGLCPFFHTQSWVEDEDFHEMSECWLVENGERTIELLINREKQEIEPFTCPLKSGPVVVTLS